MELTMRKYIGINIILFVLWGIFFLFYTLYAVSGVGTSNDTANLLKGFVLIYSVKIFFNYKLFKNIFSGMMLTVLTIIYLYIMFNNDLGNIVVLICIFQIIILQTFTNLIFIKKIRNNTIINFVIFNFLIFVFILINLKLKTEGNKNNIKFLINILFNLALIVSIYSVI